MAGRFVLPGCDVPALISHHRLSEVVMSQYTEHNLRESLNSRRPFSALCNWRSPSQSECPPIMVEQRAISLATSRNMTGILGYNWVFLTHGTSFYIRIRHAPLATFKISLHGPDNRKGISGPVNFLYADRNAFKKSQDAGGKWFSQNSRRTEFTGRYIAPGIRHVVRIRTDWSLFSRGTPSAPIPALGSASFHGLLPAPKLLRASNIDVFVSDGTPYWPDPEAAREARAGFGPIVNKAGQSLTLVAEEVGIHRNPDPFELRKLTDDERVEATRAVIAAPDETGLCWVCERLVPVSHVRDGKFFPVVY